MTKLTEADIKAMGESDLYATLNLIEEEIKAREEGGFAEGVRDYLRRDADAELREEVAAGGGAVRLTFGSDHWDDGYFYDEHSGMLTLADGSEAEVDFYHTSVHDALTDLSGVRRREYGLDRYSILVVDLVTGVVEHEVRA